MSVKGVMTNAVLFLMCIPHAFAQLEDPSVPLIPASNSSAGVGMGNQRPGDLFPGVIESDRPRTVFERFEMNRALIKFPSDFDRPAPAGAAGTVSVSELRHPLSKDGAALVQKAQQLSRAGKQAEAIEVLRELLTDSASAGYARSLLGIEYLKMEDFKAASAHLKIAVTLMPWLPANHSNLGYALCRMGDRQSGEQELRAALNLDRRNPKTNFLLGVILLDKGLPEARDHLRLALNAVKRAHLALAVFYARRGEKEPARNAVKEYIQGDGSVASNEVDKFVAYAASLAAPASAFGFPSPLSQ